MPSRVQASISICGKTLRWLISFSFGNRSSSGVRICVRSRISTSASVSLQALRQHIDVLDVIVPDRDVVAGELAEAVERAHRVEIIVEDRDLHDAPPRLRGYFTASNSTSNISVAFGGMTPPAPRAP